MRQASDASRPPGDGELMARVKARDLAAFEQLYRRYHPRLTRFLMNLVRRTTVVEEVLNDTMMVVWERPESFAGASRLSTWLFAIAYRKAMKALKRLDEPVEDTAEELAAEAGPEQALGVKRLGAALHAGMNTLSPTHRAVMDLTYFHEMSYREIAEIMDCPEDTVKTRMFHARRHMKRTLSGRVQDWL